MLTVPARRLITIPFSHFCEKARWALDLAEIDFEEEQHLPGLHARATHRAGGTTVPVLSTPSRVITDSTSIMTWAESHASNGLRLWPHDERSNRDARSLVATLDDGLGSHARRLAYAYFLPSPRAFLAVAYPRARFFERIAIHLLSPLAGAFIRRRPGGQPSDLDKERARVRSVFDEVDSRLQKTGAYLFDDQFGAADITFAALASPLLLPPGHPEYAADRVERLPGPLRALTNELRGHPAGKFALDLYVHHRRSKAPRSVA